MYVRPPRPNDAEALFDLVAACDRAELGFVDYEPADAIAELTRPDLDLARDAWVVPDGDRLAGYASAGRRPGTPQVDVEVYVCPDAPDVVFDELLARIRHRTAEHAAASGSPAAVASTFAPVSTRSRSAARLAAGGWRPVRRFSRMVIELDPDTDQAEPPVPASVRLLLGADAPETALHRIIMESFADHFGHTPEPFEAWLERQRTRPGYDPELWLIAEVDGQPAGALLGVRMAEQGWVGALGVRPRYRRRGLGHLLLRTGFALFARRGYRRVELGVDTDGTTGAYRLYVMAGMRPVMEHNCYQVEIPTSPAS